MIDEGKVAAELASLRATVERIEKVITPFLVKRPTRKQQAKKLGVSPVTLWRREKKARLELLANGRR